MGWKKGRDKEGGNVKMDRVDVMGGGGFKGWGWEYSGGFKARNGGLAVVGRE